MSNFKKDHAEELIKEAAKNLFFIQGRFDTTTQEIADKAGVNRTLINYYFRSRDRLMQTVFEEAKEVEKKKSLIIKQSDLPFRQKVEAYVEQSLSSSLKYPYLETYIVSQMNKGICEKQTPLEDALLADFFQNLKTEMDKGIIEKMDPVQFLLNMASLLMFPSAVRPLLQEKLKLSSLEFDAIIAERKNIIMKLLFKNKD